jgi:histidinol dehydrogenase
MRLIHTTSRRTEEMIQALIERGGTIFNDVLPVTGRILSAVRKTGDEAVIKYAQRFDRLLEGTALRIAPEETEAAWKQLDPTLKDALKTAERQIRRFARRQLPKSWSTSPIPGLVTGQLVRPLESVGCYVPGGRHPLPSTMLMIAIPAQIAGVQRIVVTSPNPAPETLATAHLLGITEFYRIGGAHAIGALAYGTQSIARVGKIVGPGNLYVTAAKCIVAQDLGQGSIDMLAGPTEIVVTSDKGKPADIAADLVAQAEHDPAALAIFITSKKELARAVVAEAKQQSRTNPIAKRALVCNGCVILCKRMEEAHKITNRLAPEHLTVDSEADLAWVQNAGSVFIGRYSPQPMGDYISGPNHTLPTGGLARLRGGLSVLDFVKLITVQQYTAQGLKALGPQAIRLAEAEGLTGHADAIRTRIKSRSTRFKSAKGGIR